MDTENEYRVHTPLAVVQRSVLLSSSSHFFHIFNFFLSDTGEL